MSPIIAGRSGTFTASSRAVPLEILSPQPFEILRGCAFVGKVGGRYKMEEGEIEMDFIEPIGLPDITPELARASGFLGVVDLLKVANHSRGSNIYLVRFHYVRPRRKR